MNNSIIGGSESPQPGTCLPLDVNVIVMNSKKSASTVLPDFDSQEERTTCTIPSDCEHKSSGDNIVINIENDTETTQSDTFNKDEPTIPLIGKIDCHNLNSACRKVKSKENSHTKERRKKSRRNNSLNKFLSDVYEKKLDLHNKFTDQELEDIRSAVDEKVNEIADTLFEIDSRLKIREVILVGSAREGNQIIRPCESDVILVLDELSKPGAVTMVPKDLKDDNREYVQVQLNDNVKSDFHEISDKNCIIASRVIPCRRQGLKDLFFTTVYQAVVRCSGSCIKRDTGKLKLYQSKPTINGPATTIQLQWERTTTQKHTKMEMSIDLCPAVELDFEDYLKLLPPVKNVLDNTLNRNSETIVLSSDEAESNDCGHSKVTDTHTASCDSKASNDVQGAEANEEAELLANKRTSVQKVRANSDATECHRLDNENSKGLNYAKHITYVLLMPRDGMRFKVTFTEDELLLTSDLSENHKKCYRLMKYFVNGEPCPAEKNKIINKIAKYMDLFHLSRRVRHSYILKQVVWDHQYIQRCYQEKDLDQCVTEMVSKLKFVEELDIKHPFNSRHLISHANCNDNIRKNMSLMSAFDLVYVWFMIYTFKKIQKKPIEEYDYKTCVRNLTYRQYLVFVHLLCLLCFYMIFVVLVGDTLRVCIEDTNIIYRYLKVLVRMLFIGTWFYLYIPDRTIYNKWTSWANHLLSCTKHVRFLLSVAVMALIVVVLLAFVVDSSMISAFVSVFVLFVFKMIMMANFKNL